AWGGGGAHVGPPHVQMTDAWGIADGYHDAFGDWRVPSPTTREALRRAMGAEGDAPPPAPVIVRRAGERIDIPEPTRLILEDGAELDFDGPLPADAPPGYHQLRPRDDRPPMRPIDAERVIDRARVFDLKMDALARLWAKSARPSDDFERWVKQRGTSLREFAVFCVLAEHHGGGWHGWPAEHRRPTEPAVARFADAHAQRVRFHEWLQWLAEGQLAAAADEIGIMQDLPI